MISDFGFAKESPGKLITQVGTAGFIAPEIEIGKEYSGFLADIFSAGVILFMFVSFKPPFSKAKLDDYLYKLIANRNYAEFWNYWSKFKGGDPFSDEL